MTAPKRRAVPPFEVRRDAAGYVDGIVRGGWLVLHLATSQRNEENADLIVARLNAAPLDWPLRYNGRLRRPATATATATAIRESGLMGSTGEDMP